MPHAGTWIENSSPPVVMIACNVVPRAGTWIENHLPCCGCRIWGVVPHAGTWIEKVLSIHAANDSECRAPRGHVD